MSGKPIRRSRRATKRRAQPAAAPTPAAPTPAPPTATAAGAPPPTTNTAAAVAKARPSTTPSPATRAATPSKKRGNQAQPAREEWPPKKRILLSKKGARLPTSTSGQVLAARDKPVRIERGELTPVGQRSPAFNPHTKPVSPLRIVNDNVWLRIQTPRHRLAVAVKASTQLAELPRLVLQEYHAAFAAGEKPGTGFSLMALHFVALAADPLTGARPVLYTPAQVEWASLADDLYSSSDADANDDADADPHAHGASSTGGVREAGRGSYKVELADVSKVLEVTPPAYRPVVPAPPPQLVPISAPSTASVVSMCTSLNTCVLFAMVAHTPPPPLAALASGDAWWPYLQLQGLGEKVAVPPSAVTKPVSVGASDASAVFCCTDPDAMAQLQMEYTIAGCKPLVDTAVGLPKDGSVVLRDLVLRSLKRHWIGRVPRPLAAHSGVAGGAGVGAGTGAGAGPPHPNSTVLRSISQLLHQRRCLLFGEHMTTQLTELKHCTTPGHLLKYVLSNHTLDSVGGFQQFVKLFLVNVQLDPPLIPPRALSTSFGTSSWTIHDGYAAAVGAGVAMLVILGVLPESPLQPLHLLGGHDSAKFAL